MRVFTVFFHPSTKFTAFGGAEKRFIEILRVWLSKGIKVTVVDSQPGMLAKQLVNCEVLELPSPLHSSGGKWLSIYFEWVLWIIKACLSCPSMIRREDYNVIVAPNNTLPNLLIAALLRFVSHKPLCVVVHHMDFPYVDAKATFWYVYAGYRKVRYSRLQSSIKATAFFAMLTLLKHADVCIAVSNATARFLVENGVSQYKVHVSGNGVDTAYIASFKAGEKIYEGVFVGRIARDKGVFDLVESWKEVIKERPIAQLVIIGSGPDSLELNLFIKKTGMEKNVLVKGRCSDRQMYLSMKTSKVFVLPSMFEGWGMAVAEALACGLPAVCYDIPAIKEVFGRCKSVFLVPPGDVDKLTSTIIRVLQMDLNELANISKTYVKNFDWNKIALKDLEIIQRAIGLIGSQMKKVD